MVWFDFTRDRVSTQELNKFRSCFGLFSLSNQKEGKRHDSKGILKRHQTHS